MQTPELNLSYMTIIGSSIAYGGALFPPAFPEEGKEMVPADLFTVFRLNSHDYVGSQIEPAPLRAWTGLCRGKWAGPANHSRFPEGPADGSSLPVLACQLWRLLKR